MFLLDLMTTVCRWHTLKVWHPNTKHNNDMNIAGRHEHMQDHMNKVLGCGMEASMFNICGNVSCRPALIISIKWWSLHRKLKVKFRKCVLKSIKIDL
jgi:hypothetical protein